MTQYLSNQDYADYGQDLVLFAKKAAAEAVAPHIQALDQQNLRSRLAGAGSPASSGQSGRARHSQFQNARSAS